MVFYLFWTIFIVGFRIDHLYFFLLVTVLFTLHLQTRMFVYGFVFFAVFWILYDSLRVIPNYMVSEVHIEQPYLIEKALFGIQMDGQVYTPNEYFRLKSKTILDVLSGIFYLTWVPVPMALAFYFFLTDKKHLLRYSGAYLFTNLLGFTLYYSYPAAPPWYFDQYGTALLMDLPGDPALLAKFDIWLGMPLFTDMYTKNSNIFAAIPSLHSAYPVVALYYAYIKKLKWVSLLIFIDMIGIWFAAVYTFHHYFIDVLIGLSCAVLAIFIYEKWMYPLQLTKWYTKYLKFAQS